MVLKGNPVSPGAALGHVHVYRSFSPEASESFIEKNAAGSEKKRYEETREKAAAEIQDICNSLKNDDPKKTNIFSAHLDILNDPAAYEEITERIETGLCAGDWAIWNIYTKYINMLLKTEDAVIRERYVDFEDVRNRILRIWHGFPESNLSSLTAPVIVAAKDLLPSDTATIDRRNVLAIITETGGSTSHSAIIARSYGIPAILGIPNLLDKIKHGAFAAVDAFTGEVFTEPDNETITLLSAKRERSLKEAAETKTFQKIEPITADGYRMEIGLNIGSANDEELAGAEYTDFAGLFRTEFLFMGRSTLPCEEEQFAAYRKVLEIFGKKPVYLRTLDIGGDKTLSCLELPKEDNPFLGKRALRLCFGNPGIFKTQLRAALRASVFGNLHLMLPMVGSIDDIRHAKAIIEEARAELEAEGARNNWEYKLGIMIEVPSIALIADIAAAEIDFASIGTNDLCQYLCAADRMNPEVSGYYQSFHPAMFRLIGETAAHFNRAGKPLSVCGEMGGNPLAAAVLTGLGIRKLSMGPASIAPVKRMLSHLSVKNAEEIADKVKGFCTAAEVENYLEREPLLKLPEIH
ncbi:MAG: phosphoenolpyruvate--protein phosphotransferase [Treponema sp.]|nr:phosphoenolpyruvate--protein phosphotransferase [Treponema sp.]